MGEGELLVEARLQRMGLGYVLLLSCFLQNVKTVVSQEKRPTMYSGCNKEWDFLRNRVENLKMNDSSEEH
ncbi:hypothetical protein MTR_3g027175 [Medicago truncatula]|uniref:Uncharacterized protein n=1 Tax=Medicago truncatula TaxID=3880 RepID=A0A072UUX8_MEDTR|nr:hypothetical protein MTR_3g027175 [Medicago truncatula]